MHIYIVGNPLVKDDHLPLQLFPALKKAFPRTAIMIIDPNENFIPEEGSMIVDTVHGIDRVQLFTDLDAFVMKKSVSPHDYDLGFHLQLLMKLNKISGVRVIGVPPRGTKKYIAKSVIGLLKNYIN